MLKFTGSMVKVLFFSRYLVYKVDLFLILSLICVVMCLETLFLGSVPEYLK